MLLYKYHHDFFEKSVLEWLVRAHKRVEIQLCLSDVERWDQLLWTATTFLPHTTVKRPKYNYILLLPLSPCPDHESEMRRVVVFEPHETFIDLGRALYFLHRDKEAPPFPKCYIQSDNGIWREESR